MPSINLPSAAQIDQLINKNRNSKIYEVIDLAVEAGAYIQLTDKLDISKYPILYVTVLANAAHSFGLNFAFNYPQTEQRNVVEAINSIYGESEWVEVKGTALRSYLFNKDTASHTYKVMIFGVS